MHLVFGFFRSFVPVAKRVRAAAPIRGKPDVIHRPSIHANGWQFPLERRPHTSADQPLPLQRFFRYPSEARRKSKRERSGIGESHQFGEFLGIQRRSETRQL